jgi:DNA repair exonuclease SbcCD ATPase subunit
MTTGNELRDIRDLLTEIRDLLRPVADAYQDDYDRRQAEREESRLAAIRAELSSEKRKKAWALIDGNHTQQQIANESQMAKGNLSSWFKTLRELGAISDSSTPEKLVKVGP